MLQGRIKLYLSIIVLFIFSMSCNNKARQNSSIQLFAAAGTTLPSEEICDLFSQQNQIIVNRNFASSGTLARQIYNGAHSDIFISANKQWIDFLNSKNLLEDKSIQKLANNKLVIICPLKNDSLSIEFDETFDILQTVPNKIALGNPEYVPAGKYSKQVLDSLNWYAVVEKKALMAKDVVSVLKYVELGEVDWGIVYYSEALKSKKVRIVAEIPEVLYSPVVFYISLLKESNLSSSELYDFFRDSASLSIFEKYGFLIE
jgi:molybdate transport system substrate-binding protein